ncbi:MAG: hypothetical protein MUF33_01810 [Candidatus Nanopelagicales bacterium]|jgi:hypothetical protein|nr:hypothetical protein [Candidatus Nanopelagicales bacterium]MCU0297238.1 hypothetical protein [Candidatus Nanopelagicales bacterium]
MSNDEPSDKVPYDENAWERIVAELGDGMPQLPPDVPASPPPEPEESFVPPEPPPLPKIDTVGRFAWAGTIGGPLLLFGGVLAPGIVGPAAVTLGIAAFVLGFLTLVLRSPHEPEDGWDDGSVV